MPRCCNIDWLEVFAIEPSEARDAEFFTSQGFYVKIRDYGTRHYEEVLTLHDRYGDPFMEVRRKPRGIENPKCIFPVGACTLRLVNRYCYFNGAGDIMADFINLYHYEYRRIFRLDLCLDLERFDSGDYPRKVVKRIVNHSYAKVYQANRRIIGTDRWDGCVDNSLSWGNKKSMVVTRFYNKSLELKEEGYKKPWIVQAWFESGLIDNPITRTKKTEKGKEYTPEIWRLEFQINSSARKWFKIDAEEGEVWVEHNPENYNTREKIEFAISQLVPHYFRFKIYRKDISKYECKDKVLFDFKEIGLQYKLSNCAIKRVYNDKVTSIIDRLKVISLQIGDAKAKEAMNVVIKYFEDLELMDFNYNGVSPKLLQLIMALSPSSVTFEQVKAIEKEIFF